MHTNCEECQLYKLLENAKRHLLRHPTIVAALYNNRNMEKKVESGAINLVKVYRTGPFTTTNDPNQGQPQLQPRPQPRLQPRPRLGPSRFGHPPFGFPMALPTLTSSPSSSPSVSSRSLSVVPAVDPSVTKLPKKVSHHLVPDLNPKKFIKLKEDHWKVANEQPPLIVNEMVIPNNFVPVQKSMKEIRRQSWLEDEILTRILITDDPNSSITKNLTNTSNNETAIWLQASTQHQITSQDDEVLVANFGVEAAASADILRTNVVKKYDCLLKCGRSYTKKDALSRHMREHRGEQPYPCAFQCGKYFTRSDHRLAHERAHTKPFTCGHCRATFPNITMAEMHILHVHPYYGPS